LFDRDIILFALVKRSPGRVLKLVHSFYCLNILILLSRFGVLSIRLFEIERRLSLVLLLSPRTILEILLDKYAEKGVEEFNIPTTFKANREFDNYGNVVEIAERFGGVQELKEAVNQLQSLLYSA
jgi:EcoEI R protein C-terminal